MGQLANEVRAALENALEEQGKKLEAQALDSRLKAEALDAWQPVALSVSGGRVEGFTALSWPDRPEERRVRPLPGPAEERLFYTQLMDEVRGNPCFCQRAIEICKEVVV